MRLLVADSVHDYVAAIRALIQLPEQMMGMVLPVYSSWRDEPVSWDLFPSRFFEEERVVSHSVNDSLPDPVALSGELAGKLCQHIVFGLQGSMYAYTAVLHAYITGRVFVCVESLDDLIHWLLAHPLPADATITICAEPDFFDQRSLNRLFAAVSQDFLPGRPLLRNAIGFLTAPTVGALSFLLLKTYCYPSQVGAGKSLLITPFASRNTIHATETYDILCREDCSTEAIQSLLDRPRAAVAFYSHSHEDCIFLGTDIIEAASSPVFGERLSRISSHGQKAAHGISMPTSAIRCQILLANMCTGIKFVNGLYSSAQNIGLGFVTGWPACYIAPTTVKNDSSPDALFFLHLMSIGYPSGEIMRAMNAVLANLSSDPQIYILVGDPLVYVTMPEPALLARVTRVEEAEVTLQVDMKGTATALIRIPHPHILAWIKAGQCYLSEIILSEEVRKKIQVDYLLLPSKKPDELLLILFSPSSLGTGRVYLTFTSLPPISGADTMALEQCLIQADNLIALSLFPHKLAGMQTELENMVKNTALFMQAMHNVGAYQKAQQQVSKMLTAMDKLQKEILTLLLERLSRGSLAFTEKYADQMLATHCSWIESVCICGEPLYYRILAHPIMHHLRRHILLCPRCGIISDSPDNGVTTELIGSTVLVRNETTILKLHIHNATEHALTCRVVMAIEYSKFMQGDYEVNPSGVTSVVHAGTTETILFGITCSADSAQDVYFLKTLIMYNMNLICLHRPISICS